MITNQAIVDEVIGHQVDLQFYANDVVYQEVGKLNAADEALMIALLLALVSLPVGASPDRVDTALVQTFTANDTSYRTLEQSLSTSLSGVLDAEVTYQEELLVRTRPDEQVSKSDKGVLAVAMLGTPMLGATIHDSVEGLALQRKTAMRRVVQAGFVSKLTADQVIKQIREEVLEPARRHLETTIRASVAHATEYAAAAIHATNKDLIASVIWLSVLDSGTTDQCRIRAGKRYTAGDHRPIGHNTSWGAGPGRLHWNCRSSSAPLLRGELPKDNSYNDWLRRQNVKTQDEVLGRTRGQAYRQGGLTVESFVNNKGRRLTLNELKDKGVGIF